VDKLETPTYLWRPPKKEKKRKGIRNENKTYQRTDRVSILEKMTERVLLSRQEEEDRRSRQEVSNITITQDESVDEEDMSDDEGVQDEREIWQTTHVSEEELETTEGERVDMLAPSWQLLELVGWSEVNDKETEKNLS
jgi:hypothetical protein